MSSCADPNAAATVTNDPLHVTPKQQRKALVEHGWIICGLYEASTGSKVARLTFGGGRKGVTYSVLNVSCDLHPTSPTRYRDQEQALEKIVLVLSKQRNA